MIRITINNTAETFNSETLTVAELVTIKNIPEKGTAIAVNGRIARKANWETTTLKDGDSIILISAAYGG